jgi:hypothetical protein
MHRVSHGKDEIVMNVRFVMLDEMLPNLQVGLAQRAQQNRAHCSSGTTMRPQEMIRASWPPIDVPHARDAPKGGARRTIAAGSVIGM